MLFEAEFLKEIDKQLAEKQTGAGKTLAEQMGVHKTKPVPIKATQFTIQGDDANNTRMWESLMKDCAYYYDVPTIEDEIHMRKTLQRKYDGILQAGWRPPLTSRRDLLTWACKQYNTSQEGKESPEVVNCENYSALIHVFGPDYNRLRPKLGHVRGLFD